MRFHTCEKCKEFVKICPKKNCYEISMLKRFLFSVNSRKGKQKWRKIWHSEVFERKPMCLLGSKLIVLKTVRFSLTTRFTKKRQRGKMKEFNKFGFQPSLKISVVWEPWLSLLVKNRRDTWRLLFGGEELDWLQPGHKIHDTVSKVG